MTKVPPPPLISLAAEVEDGAGTDANRVPPPCTLTVNESGTIILKIDPPEPGVEPGSAEDKAFHDCMDWLFLEWSIKSWDDNPKSSMGAVKTDNEDGFESWISCNHRLIYHYDHYVTARENVSNLG